MFYTFTEIYRSDFGSLKLGLSMVCHQSDASTDFMPKHTVFKNPQNILLKNISKKYFLCVSINTSIL